MTDYLIVNIRAGFRTVFRRPGVFFGAARGLSGRGWPASNGAFDGEKGKKNGLINALTGRYFKQLKGNFLSEISNLAIKLESRV
ncbi:MAG: hypothetical protein LBQ12_00075 [Deltaproteobacteria bacterium]|nr:hypothetical protein [Deltaproteobacteria bacterium]